MFKKMVAISMVIATMFTLGGCGAKEEAKEAPAAKTEAVSEAKAEDGPAKAEEKPIELKFTSVSVPGDSHTEAMDVFAKKVEELSGGSVKVKVYHSGSLFSAENEFDALINGDADMAYISNPTLATKIDYFNMFTAGYFFKDYNHMTSTLNGDIGKNKIRKDIEEQVGIVPLSSFYLGSREINTTKKAINSYEDMNGLLLRMPNSPAWLFLGKALGANPTPMSFTEVYTGLSTGAIDAQDNPLPTVQSAKFYEVTKYIAVTNHVIDSIYPSVNKKVWDSMSEKQKQAMMDAAEAARDFCDTTNIKKEEELLKFFEEKGLTITHPNLDEFREKVQAAYLNDKEQVAKWDMGLYEEIQALAK
ncbi:MAG: DctP family transporter solute-binding subunit [Clostridia bacterium]|jgi:tripartite ATP-independent transporter DctP family solute receptor|nr:DctP family transporter solute-binding subunit [Clostridia bacterium]